MSEPNPVFCCKNKQTNKKTKLVNSKNLVIETSTVQYAGLNSPRTNEKLHRRKKQTCHLHQRLRRKNLSCVCDRP